VNIRRLFGQKIGQKTKLKFGTLIISNNIQIGKDSKIGPFTLIKAENLSIGDYTVIKPLVLIKALTIEIKNYVKISILNIINSELSESSFFSIGDHSSIFPYCWIEPGEGIFIGENVGIGGHTLMFTHGSWPNYVEGGPVSFGSITIENDVWLPWRVFILPNVKIGAGVIVGANSLINKDIEECTLVAGSPAKVIKKIIKQDIDKVEKMNVIIEHYAKHIEFKDNITTNKVNNDLWELGKINISIDKNANTNDLIIFINNPIPKNIDCSYVDYNKKTVYYKRQNKKEVLDFVGFIRKFGIRLYIQQLN